MGLPEECGGGLYIGGLLHDIGKISVPESILSKPGELSKKEWALGTHSSGSEAMKY